MNKNYITTLFFLQSLGLLGADYTAEDVQKIFSEIQEIKLNLPKGTSFTRMKTDRMICRNCGKTMRLKCDVALMEQLTAYLNKRCSNFLRFELDTTKLCPHCGDGRIYLRNQQKKFSLQTKKTDWSEWSEPVPVNEEDLLLCVSGFCPGSEVIAEKGKHSVFWRSVFYVGADTFTIMTAAEYDTKFANVKIPQDKREQWAVRAEFIQKLTECASVLRRKDLDSFLKQLNSPELRRVNSEQTLLSRMMIGPHHIWVWEKISCPVCKNNFYVQNGLPGWGASPLGDYQTCLQKLDMVPDYSSLCPCCHPNDKRRLLRMDVKLSGKKYTSDVSPDDLTALLCFVRGKYPLPAGKILRLRKILQGVKDDELYLAAEPVVEEK